MTLREAVEICQDTDWLFRRPGMGLHEVGRYDTDIVGCFSYQDLTASDWEIIKPGDGSCFPR